jgi:tetratricopeptide (TPR) repeat protein
VYRSELGNTYLSLGTALLALADEPQGEAMLRRSVDHYSELVKEFPRHAGHRGDLGWALGNLGGLYRKQGRLRDARDHLDRGIKYVREALDANPKDRRYRQSLRYQYSELGETALKLEDHGAAAAAALAFPDVLSTSGRDYYLAGRLLARCIPVAEADAALTGSKRDTTVRAYARDATKQLQRAADRGYTAMRNSLYSDVAFEPLRSHPTFQALLKTLPPKGIKR